MSARIKLSDEELKVIEKALDAFGFLQEKFTEEADRTYSLLERIRFYQKNTFEQDRIRAKERYHRKKQEVKCSIEEL